MTVKKINEWVEKLGLVPHPEGGYNRQTYISDTDVDVSGKAKKLYTSIYFLLTGINFIKDNYRYKSES
ncbi:hypothetical protein BACCIP111883_03467 [Sutcliffiella rhizosphaerae]|uniref:DUF985 domain-containing protein n=1 Tax=Sutcliffiella rhizosphaerae TaxID=2880967 RepID=A0ABM8YRU2_9BACI|nr:cupin domain-containing protein [Sutcliffiella rhizosphaerae]CAG9622676.1 hypothetical protein BACCIP111883_03467 [Sutcliffiella rhizosphaerae]